ncbi:hypothetical protein TSAR_010737 [Trichomalopsis sarcophagae]|uniref:Uncharacterized protein n=1 Tax=Trichomalopsis sarcophagae TaxID=543379 RepID=A0A232EF65_9HYME|nr:hypothetical protein TSAR_010737 [Trichomalopsis sarcophagae]
MLLNNGYFSTNLKGLENSVTRHFFDFGTSFCMVLNMYNKKKKLQPENCIFPVEFPIYVYNAMPHVPPPSSVAHQCEPAICIIPSRASVYTFSVVRL